MFLLLGRIRKQARYELARKTAIQYWKRTYEEDLTKWGTRGSEAHFDANPERTFYAFRFYRRGPTEAGRPYIVVVKYEKGQFDVAGEAYNPSDEEVRNPFAVIEQYLHATPVPHESIPKYMDIPMSVGRKRSGVKINIGNVGASQEPPQQEEEK